MKILISLVIIIVSMPCFAGGDVTYYDENGEITVIEDAYYYRASERINNSGRYKVTDYYMDGQVAKYGFYLTPDFKVKDGPFTYYYPDGTKKSQGNYDANRRVGEWVWWYPDGSIMQEVIVEHTPTLPPKEIHLIKNFWDDNHNQLVTNGEGLWVNFEFDQNHGSLYYRASEGRVKDGKKIGRWIGYDKEGNKIYFENYREGSLTKGQSLDDAGNKYSYRQQREAPMPKGGLDRFYSFVLDNLRYPLLAASTNVEGRVLVQFDIEKDGAISNVRAVQGPGWGCEEEAERIIKEYGEWKPGVLRGQLRKSTMVVPISFRL